MCIRDSGSHLAQLYGSGTSYGFLDANWANWDIKKIKNGIFEVDEGAGLMRVWNAGNDGAGSGLDADLLDGNQSSFFAPLANPTFTGTLVSPIIRARKSQTQSSYTTAALWTESFSSTSTGIAFHISGNVGKMLDMRTNGHLYWEGGRVWSATSDGSGSGLDADLLDGQQGSYYYAASNPSGFQTAAQVTASTVQQSHYVSGNAFATAASSPGSVLEYQQAASISDTKLAPTTDWYNSIRMGHGNPYSYYSNTIAMQMTGTGYGQIKTQTIVNNTAAGWRTVWDSGNDGSGSALDADLLDGQHGSYYAPNSSLANYILKGGHTTLGSTWKTTFYSGGGGASFAANHYSMGVDYANGSWSAPNYSDLIIGYHTGIRIGAAYGGTKFYNNSPTCLLYTSPSPRDS